MKAEGLLADSDSDDPKDEDDDPNEDGDEPNVDLESDIDNPKGGRWRERERSSARICSSPETEAITLRLMLYPNKLLFPPKPTQYTKARHANLKNTIHNIFHSSLFDHQCHQIQLPSSLIAHVFAPLLCKKGSIMNAVLELN